jgi:hypothetical protein
MPVDQLVRSLCDTKQIITQYGGVRPFGVSLLYAGWCDWLPACLLQHSTSIPDTSKSLRECS